MHPILEILERFQKDVDSHEMEVLHDDGLYRHLRFSNGGSSIYQFNITTWPGYLCISGDMGCFVFSRVRDMFGFFRGEDGQLGINPGYWMEKVQAGAGSEVAREICTEWDEEDFRAEIRKRFDDYVEDEELDEAAAAELWSEIEDEVLEETDLEAVAMRNAMEFRHDDFEFTDFFEVRCTKYTFRYLWCCWAIVWGIGVYDKAKEAEAA